MKSTKCITIFYTLTINIILIIEKNHLEMRISPHDCGTYSSRVLNGTFQSKFDVCWWSVVLGVMSLFLHELWSVFNKDGKKWGQLKGNQS